ncbi:MAG: hypothetical protein JWQ44_40 [Chthoniobacter sp.]|nr:hypothetical protein [Chthoniobacter sp.]
MSIVQENRLWISPEEYLEGEKQATLKHEYVEGRVFAMAGANANHDLIAGNIYGLLWQQLHGRKCRVFSSDMKVKIPPTLPNCELTYYYPDVQVACKPENEFDEYFREYPAVIFEVLSPSTSSTDEREKRAAYLRIDSLEHYCIVAQEKMEVTVYRRAGRNWEIMRWTQPGDVVILGAIDCELTLGQIYERVTWKRASGTAA